VHCVFDHPTVILKVNTEMWLRKQDQNQPDGMSAVSVAAGMDVDSPFRRPHSAAPSATFLSDSPGLGDFFGADLSPPSASAFQRMAQTFKKTAFEDISFSSPESTIDSPSVPQGMMNQSLGFKAHSGRALLPPPTFNVRGPIGLANRRQDPLTKKSLAVATQLPVSRGLMAGSTATALPILESVTGQPSAACNFAKPARIATHPPMRRAFSVCDQGSPSVPSTARDRTGVVGGASGASRVVSQIEIGLTKMPEYQSTGMQIGQLGNASAVGRGTGDSSFTQAGLLGFGANEIDGKILPCHSVKEDGLVRITQSTVSQPNCQRGFLVTSSLLEHYAPQLREVLEGRFSESMSRFHIVDCRFQYEYEGGHIKGAVNINSNSALEELLLCAGKGIHSEGKNLPLPCRSGETQETLPAVIIFHCEFSNKRAPAL
jgi:M-phase inducer tyrosine phosphatase